MKSQLRVSQSVSDNQRFVSTALRRLADELDRISNHRYQLGAAQQHLFAFNWKQGSWQDAMDEGLG